MISKETLFNSEIPFIDRFRKVFEYQSVQTGVYREFLKSLGYNSGKTVQPDTIPLLPIRAFRYKKVIADGLQARLAFKSSGTSEMGKSTHLIADPEIYKTAIIKEFEKHFPFDQYSLICYMPGYQENEHSSLIWMAQYLIHYDPDRLSCFLPDKRSDVEKIFTQIRDKGKNILLFGAAFGLLDLIEMKKMPTNSQFEILETGGMKTYKREINKSELRNRLSQGFQVEPDKIHSEYGMCELLSQMYAIGGEWFQHPDWVYVTIRDHENPEIPCEPDVEGKIGIIDLANVNSCSFILTDDRGVMDQKGRFKVLGRWSNTNLRGCNFLVDD